MSLPVALPDWSQPWLQDWRPIGERVADEWQRGGSLPDALNREQPAGLQFVPQEELPQGVAYEQHIFETGCCPTRENLHDFFNGLCWLRFARIKRRLNELQAGEIARAGVQALRGPLRDALTVFDENAAFLQAPEPLWQALRSGDWHALFVRQRSLWRQARLTLFGHALLEKLQQPRTAITAHVYHLPLDIALAQDLDTCVADSLRPQGLAAKPFLPLPVLGVPGWWPANASAGFYDDATVFRPARHRS